MGINKTKIDLKNTKMYFKKIYSIFLLAAQSEAEDANAVKVAKPLANSFLANFNAKANLKVADWEEVAEAVGELIEEYWFVAPDKKFDAIKAEKIKDFKPSAGGKFKGKFGKRPGKFGGKFKGGKFGGKWGKKG